MKTTAMGDFKDLIVYQKAYQLSMEIFALTKKFPTEEKYSLTDQIRRSSRSVSTNLAEAYRRRKYKPHFLSKLTDCDAENSETEVWIDFAKDCLYVTQEEHMQLQSQNTEVRKILYYMSNNPDKFM